jgi:hypothetical protein
MGVTFVVRLRLILKRYYIRVCSYNTYLFVIQLHVLVV